MPKCEQCRVRGRSPTPQAAGGRAGWPARIHRPGLGPGCHRAGTIISNITQAIRQ